MPKEDLLASLASLVFLSFYPFAAVLSLVHPLSLFLIHLLSNIIAFLSTLLFQMTKSLYFLLLNLHVDAHKGSLECPYCGSFCIVHFDAKTAVLDVSGHEDTIYRLGQASCFSC